MRFKRLDIEDVRRFIGENSDCQLLSNEYQNNRQILKFTCGCGNEFETSYNKFKDGNKRQCNECGKELINISKRLTIEFVRNFVEENSDCGLLSDEYKNNHTKLKMSCGCGSVFKVRFDDFVHLGRRQCKPCGSKKISDSRSLNIDGIRNYVKENTDCQLLSTKCENAHEKLRFQCECGNAFFRNWNNFKSGSTLCRICAKRQSKGEKAVSEYLESKGIKFIIEHTFPDCRYKRMLPFDFYIPNINTCIEYDGEFHFDTDRIPFNNHVLQQKRDAIKTKFCKDNNIKLIRIPYYDFKRIDEILEGAL